METIDTLDDAKKPTPFNKANSKQPKNETSE